MSTTTKPTFTLAQMMQRYSTEEACKQFLQERRWPNGVECPRCGNKKVYELKSKPFHWVCKGKECGKRNGYRFSVISKTVFENTNYDLRVWFQVIYLMTQSKKGISALQIQREIGSGAYKTAWYMCHRIRAAMQDGSFSKLMGEVEVDETYIGGSDARHGPRKRGDHGPTGKTAVIGAIARKGNVVCKVIESADSLTLNPILPANGQRKGFAGGHRHLPSLQARGPCVPPSDRSPEGRICARERPHCQPG